MASALRRPTAKTGSARNGVTRACAAMAWAALALVIKIAAHGPAPICASADRLDAQQRRDDHVVAVRAQRRGGALRVGLGAREQKPHV